MAQLFQATPANNLPDVPNYNVCPTTQIHVVRAGVDARDLVSMRWGFVPRWYKGLNDGPLLINARAETIAEKPAFRDACRARRCLIPAAGFYEWTKDKDSKRLPWYIYRADGSPVVFAGIWQDWGQGGEQIASCAIVTTSANETLSAIHHRMPVIVNTDEYGLWLGEEGKGAARLMRAAGEDELAFHRVNARVNSNRASGEQLIDPDDTG